MNSTSGTLTFIVALCMALIIVQLSAADAGDLSDNHFSTLDATDGNLTGAQTGADTQGDRTAALGEPAHAAAEGTAASKIESRSATPQGLIIRGRTQYHVPAAKVGGVERTTIERRVGKERVSFDILDSRIRRVTLEDVDLAAPLDLGLEDIPLSAMETEDAALDAFAIDPTRIDFTSGTLTKTAVGNRVWKCALWDFASQACNGDWMLVQIVTPGTDYNITFDPVDPAYVETFDDSTSTDIGMTALDNTTFVIAFIDAGTNDASFEIWNTNGVVIVDETDIDASGDAESRIHVDAINRTHFVIGVIDGPEDDADFYIYDRNGNQALGQTQVDAATGVNDDLAVCQLGDRFGYVYADNVDSDANFRVFSNAGASLVAENAVDTTISPGALTQNLVACSAINSTYFGYAFFDDQDNDISLAFVSGTGTIQVTAVDLDTDVGETAQVASAGLSGNRTVVVFYDSTDDDITITIRGFAGAAMTTVLAATDIDTNAGNDSRVAVAEVENNGASNFVVAWHDQNDTTIKAAVYNNTGGQVTAPFTVTGTPNTTSLLLDVAGKNSIIGTGLCNYTFAIAYTNATGTSTYETYYLNGTRWNGVCGAPDTAGPNITLLNPPDSHVNDTSNTIDFYFNVSDASDLKNCTLNIDGAAHTSVQNPARGTQLNITIELDNGDYNWSMTCYDMQLNSNTSVVRNLTVNVPLLITGSDIRLAALDNTTIVIAFIDGGSNDASFEIWDVRGTRLVNTQDIDTTVDVNSRVAVSAINTTAFAVGVIDGVDGNADFYIYDSAGNAILGQTQGDAATGVNTDVAMCQFGDRFAYVWAEQNDGDANFEIWNNTGALIVNEVSADISIAPGAPLQNLVACAANSTHLAYAFYDDTDNDITLGVYTAAGAAQVAPTDLDIDVGETGQVASAGLRNGTTVVAFYDAVDQDITITVQRVNGAALTTVLAATDIDTNAGNDSRVAVAEVENNGASNFVVAWHDQNDTTIKAAVYNNTGGQVTAPFTVSSVPSTTSKLLDVSGYNSNLGFGLCNGTFAIAYTNSSGNSLYETYAINGTQTNGVCGRIPDLSGMTLATPVVLNAGTIKAVTCNFTITDLDGIATIARLNSTIHHSIASPGDPDDTNTHYSNSSCASTPVSGTVANYTCSFPVQYYALNGSWYCNATVVDVHKNMDTDSLGFVIDPLYAINVSAPVMNFGSLLTGEESNNITQDIMNVGNMRINVSTFGYGGSIGDNLSFVCPSGNLSVDLVRFAANNTTPYALKEALNSTFKSLRMTIARQASPGAPPQNTSYWQVRIPDNFPTTGECNGTIIFQAETS